MKNVNLTSKQRNTNENNILPIKLAKLFFMVIMTARMQQKRHHTISGDVKAQPFWKAIWPCV